MAHAQLMVPKTVDVGALAFLGPPHAAALAEFHYVRVTRVNGDQAYVNVISPNKVAEDLTDPIEMAVFRRRLVSNDECERQPGSFVGKPVAYIQPDGVDADTWAYAIVIAYHMETTTPVLHLRHLEGSTKVLLREPANVLKVDWADYALQVAAGTNAAALNTAELSDKLATVRVLCAKSRKGLSAKIVQELSVPFDPTELVPVIHPGTLRVVIVSRQHDLDCALKRKSKKGVSMFAPPPEPPATKVRKRKAAGPSAGGRPATRRKLSSDLSDEECDGDEREAILVPEAVQEAKREVQRQNRPLISTSIQPDDDLLPEVDLRAPTARTFRPSEVEQRIHDAIGHTDHQVTQPRMLDEPESTVNMTDVSRRNSLQPANRSPSFPELVDALDNLHDFACSFYNDAAVSVLHAIQRFINSFARSGEPDRDTTKRLLLWINTKLCKFRGLVLLEGLSSALRVTADCIVQAMLLTELLYDQQQAKIAALTAKLESKPTPRASGSANGREGHQPKYQGTPKAVLRELPKQGALQICMKYLSKDGCTGNGEPGKCFSSQRAHFRPAELPDVVQDYIVKKFGGLAPEFADL